MAYFKKTITFCGLTLMIWFITGYMFTESTISPEQNQEISHTGLPRIFNDIYQCASNYTKDGTFGIVVKDIRSQDYLSINGNITFNPASVIKVPIMAEVYHQVAQAKIKLEDTVTLNMENKMTGSGSLYFSPNGSTYNVRTLVQKMITESDNTATNMLMHYVGIDHINRYMQDLDLGHTVIRDETLLSKIPEQQNQTTPGDMLHLLELMYNGKLVNEIASAEMIAIMLEQKYRWGIPGLLPDHLKIANKTGSVDGVRNDIGIVFAENNPYLIVIFSKQVPTNEQAVLFVKKISRLVYDTLLGAYIPSENVATGNKVSS